MVEEPENNPPPGPPVDSSPSPDSAVKRCVVLVCPDGATPVDLLGGLSRRGGSSRVVVEPADVMVELARQPTGAWVVVDPEKQPGLTDLIEAVSVYHPRTVRWAYHSADVSGKAQLQPLNGRSGDDPADDPPPPATVTTEPQETEAPNITSPFPLGRVQDQVPSDRVRSLLVKVRGPAEVGEPLISEEELAMLLGPVPEQRGGEP